MSDFVNDVNECAWFLTKLISKTGNLSVCVCVCKWMYVGWKWHHNAKLQKVFVVKSRWSKLLISTIKSAWWHHSIKIDVIMRSWHYKYLQQFNSYANRRLTTNRLHCSSTLRKLFKHPCACFLVLQYFTYRCNAPCLTKCVNSNIQHYYFFCT